MKITQNLNVKLTQKLNLSHELLQSLELIQLPIVDLRERIEREVMENPALEIIEKKERSTYKDEPFLSRKFARNGSDDDKRSFIELTATRKEGLHEKLLWQLNLAELSDEKKEIGETIIQCVDSDGFFKGDLEELFPGKSDAAAEVLEYIQTFEPDGVASRDVREALLYQIESLPADLIDKNAYEIVKNHFDLMLERKDAQISKILKITLPEIKTAFEFISQFELFPGRSCDSADDGYIIPDAYVYYKEGDVVVDINDEIIPSLTVSKYLEDLSDKLKLAKTTPKEERKYVTEKVKDAKSFIGMIDHRKKSLYRVVLAVSRFQKNFFEKGPKFLVPLTMKMVAEKVGLAESTVSRLSSSKYIQTDWGLHELKYFFTNSISKEGNGDSVSSEVVREMIKEIVENNKDNKISDQKISDILQNRGINIARRTVAKYRKILNILPSSKRNI